MPSSDSNRPHRPIDAKPPVFIDFASVTPLEPTAEFVSQAAELGIEFEAADLVKLGHYLACMLKFNESTNLTAITEPAMAWRRHILDSLTLTPLIAELPEGSTVIDVGTGGGLPGIPLAICFPAIRVTLLEATGKKAEFLRQVTGALGLANVTVVAERAETAGNDRGIKTATGREGGYREAFDLATARAVGRLQVLAELVLPFVKPGGCAAVIKGEKAAEELAEAEHVILEMGGAHSGTLETPTGRIVVLDKVKQTPRMYPRADGEPQRAPIGPRRQPKPKS